jgi:hypothetical protein
LKLEPVPNADPPVATLNHDKVPPVPKPFKVTGAPSHTGADEAAGVFGVGATVACTAVSEVKHPETLSAT